jgi:hypothetical protein
MKTTNSAAIEFKEFVNELIYSVKQLPFLLMQSIRMRFAILLADMQQKAFNKRYFIIHVVKKYKEGKPVLVLRSINNTQFDLLRKKRLLPKQMTYLELSAKSFYQTDLKRNNTQKLEERQKAMRRYRQYLDYLNR